MPNEPEFQQAGKVGEQTLWVVFVLMALSTIVFAGMAYRVPVQKRLFHTSLPTVMPNEPEFQQAGKVGEQTLWVVFVLMALSTIVFAGMAYRVPVQKRLFHILAADRHA